MLTFYRGGINPSHQVGGLGSSSNFRVLDNPLIRRAWGKYGVQVECIDRMRNRKSEGMEIHPQRLSVPPGLKMVSWMGIVFHFRPDTPSESQGSLDP